MIMTTSTTKEKIVSLQGFRAIACIAVFLSHSWAGSIVGIWGGAGATAFFVLSGFLTYITNARKTMDGSLGGCFLFLIKRLKKIYPLHMTMLIISALLTFFLMLVGKSSLSMAEFWGGFVLNSFLFHTWIPNINIYYSFNGVSWFLSSYAFCIFIFPALFNWLGIHWSRLKAWGGILLAIILPTIIGIICIKYNLSSELRDWLLYANPVARFFCFFCGIQAGYVLDSGSYKSNIAKDTLIEFFSIGLLYVGSNIGLINNSYIKAFSITQMIYVPGLMTLIAVLHSGNGVLKKLLSGDLLVAIGNNSMYIFLIHQFVVQCVHMFWVNCISKNLNGFVWTMASLFFTWLGVIIYKKIEKEHVLKRVYNVICQAKTGN